jgi:hypothetical protein
MHCKALEMDMFSDSSMKHQLDISNFPQRVQGKDTNVRKTKGQLAFFKDSLERLQKSIDKRCQVDEAISVEPSSFTELDVDVKRLPFKSLATEYRGAETCIEQKPGELNRVVGVVLMADEKQQIENIAPLNSDSSMQSQLVNTLVASEERLAYMEISVNSKETYRFTFRLVRLLFLLLVSQYSGIYLTCLVPLSFLFSSFPLLLLLTYSTFSIMTKLHWQPRTFGLFAPARRCAL